MCKMLRKEWFAFVKKVRAKMQRKDKTQKVTHQNAMSAASKLWPAEKVKIQRKIARQEKKRAKEAKKKSEQENLLN